FPGLAIERVNNAGLTGNPCDDFSPLAGLDLRIDPRNFSRIGRNNGVDKNSLERMIEIPMIDDVLVVPDDLSGICIQGKRRIVIEVLVVISAKNEFGRGYRH